MSFFKKTQYRSEGYMQFVRDEGCLVTGITPCDPHHSLHGGMALKATDLSCIGLDRDKHTELHAKGEGHFEMKYNVDLRKELIVALMKYICKLEGGVVEDYDWNIRI